MTMSLGLVNLSNWKGEDIDVRHGKSKYTHHLKPGEILQFGLEHGDGAETEIVVTSRPVEKPEPFTLNGEQVFPNVVAYVGKGNEEEG